MNETTADYRTFSELTEEELNAWTEEFIELAEKEIKLYSGTHDLQSPSPWCAPWTWGASRYVTPQEELDKDKEEIEKALQDALDHLKSKVYAEFMHAFDREPTDEESKKLDDIAYRLFWTDESVNSSSDDIYWAVQEAFSEKE